ncbi:SLC1 [[Candida] subhashii]|uniref:1-acyl-sn-glycerol-3-phosphate acyltransferase n=1 Tax=[Candida] subhashii TaxID=561895 RepID=A0A8J5QMN3_9ASCO|nr:SLC1 [[Candida] subhashii]KAG7663225.1 SLC1 [[Candida] subhashii]
MSFLSGVKFYLKSVIFGSLIAGCAIYGVVASIILRLCNKLEYAQYSVARAFYNVFGLTMGLKINIKNEHYLKALPAICICNHQSALDIFVMGKVFQPGYTVTSKKSLKYVPFLGWFMALSGTFFLDRSRGEKARKVLETALVSLKKEKRALFIFPEGTRSGAEELTMLPFKKGAFHIAKQAGIPIIPVVVSNTSTIFNSRRKIFKGGEINVEILPPVSTAELETNEDVKNLCDKVREDMLEALQRVGYSKPTGEEEEEADSREGSEAPSSSSDTETEEVEVEVITSKDPVISKD